MPVGRYMASLKGYISLAKVLIERGADVDAETTSHRTALYAACLTGKQGELFPLL